jgi:hypothetical protein
MIMNGQENNVDDNDPRSAGMEDAIEPRSPPHKIYQTAANEPPKRSKRLIVAAMAVAAVVIIAALFVLAGQGGDADGGVVTKSPSEMMLASSDLPDGWQESEPEGLNPPEAVADAPYDAYATVGFNTTGDGGFETPRASIEVMLITFDSIEEARTYYSFIHDNVTGQYSSMVRGIDGHFDQCFEFQIGLGTWANTKMYIFQESNVIGVMMFGTYLNYDMPPSWIDGMLDKQESRIV